VTYPGDWFLPDPQPVLSVGSLQSAESLVIPEPGEGLPSPWQDWTTLDLIPNGELFAKDYGDVDHNWYTAVLAAQSSLYVQGSAAHTDYPWQLGAIVNQFNWKPLSADEYAYPTPASMPEGAIGWELEPGTSSLFEGRLRIRGAIRFTQGTAGLAGHPVKLRAARPPFIPGPDPQPDDRISYEMRAVNVGFTGLAGYEPTDTNLWDEIASVTIGATNPTPFDADMGYCPGTFIAAFFEPALTGAAPDEWHDPIAQVRFEEITRVVSPIRRMRWIFGDQGAWRLRQRQTLTGSDSWPLRQRQNGLHSGTWTPRQLQRGV